MEETPLLHQLRASFEADMESWSATVASIHTSPRQGVITVIGESGSEPIHFIVLEHRETSIDCQSALSLACTSMHDVLPNLACSVFQLHDLTGKVYAADASISAGSTVRLVPIKGRAHVWTASDSDASKVTVIYANVPLQLNLTSGCTEELALLEACDFFGFCTNDYYLHHVYNSTYRLVKKVKLQRPTSTSVTIMVEYQSQLKEFVVPVGKPISTIVAMACQWFGVSSPAHIKTRNESARRTQDTGIMCDFASFELCVGSMATSPSKFISVRYANEHVFCSHEVACAETGMCASELLTRVCLELDLEENLYELLCRDKIVYPNHVIHARTKGLLLRRKPLDDNPF